MDASVTEFGLESDRVYEIWPPGQLGPHDVEGIFPPRELVREDIQGGAPDIADCWNTFVGRAWNEVEDPTFETMSDIFTVMNTKSLSIVLPAILMACLRDAYCGLHSGLEFFIQREKFFELHQLLDADQQAFLISMCDFLIRNEDVSEKVEAGYATMRQRCVDPAVSD